MSTVVSEPAVSPPTAAAHSQPSPTYLRIAECSYTGERHARGIVATVDIPRGTVVESSPCLLLPVESWQEHGKHTVLEHYSFRCRNGDHMLALGLGSLFNHSQQPLLSYRIDPAALLIHFTTARDVQAGQELTIFYGTNLWFEETQAAGEGAAAAESPYQGHMDDPDAFLAAIELD